MEPAAAALGQTLLQSMAPSIAATASPHSAHSVLPLNVRVTLRLRPLQTRRPPPGLPRASEARARRSPAAAGLTFPFFMA